METHSLGVAVNDKTLFATSIIYCCMSGGLLMAHAAGVTALPVTSQLQAVQQLLATLEHMCSNAPTPAVLYASQTIMAYLS